MIITFSRNPLVRFKVWVENNIIYAIKNHYYKHKKAHYQCCVCGMIVAPYFEAPENQYNVLTDDYGWHKLDNGKYNRWICHHCADHGFSSSDAKEDTPEQSREFTWDEWKKIVENNNTKMFDIIKEKDPEYDHYWFEYGDLEE